MRDSEGGPQGDTEAEGAGPEPPLARPEERELIASLLKGDEQVFAALVDQHHPTMLRVARAYVPARGVAEEVVQETWLAILRGLPKFQGRSSLKTWMFRILTNRAKTRAKREGRTVPMSAMGPLDEDGEPAVRPDRFTDQGHWSSPPREWRTSPEQLVVNAEVREQIVAAIATLPERQRLVVTLRDLKGWTSQEVCNVLEISHTNQRVLLHRARSKVRAVVERYLDGGS